MFGQSMFYLVCFNCDLILIEHRNKHIVTFFLTIALNWYTLYFVDQVIDILGAKWYYFCASFLKSDTGKNYKTSKKTDKVIPTCLVMQMT